MSTGAFLLFFIWPSSLSTWDLVSYVFVAAFVLPLVWLFFYVSLYDLKILGVLPPLLNAAQALANIAQLYAPRLREIVDILKAEYVGVCSQDPGRMKQRERAAREQLHNPWTHLVEEIRTLQTVWYTGLAPIPSAQKRATAQDDPEDGVLREIIIVACEDEEQSAIYHVSQAAKVNQLEKVPTKSAGSDNRFHELVVERDSLKLEKKAAALQALLVAKQAAETEAQGSKSPSVQDR